MNKKNKIILIASCVVLSFIILLFLYINFYQSSKKSEKIQVTNFAPNISGKIIQLNIEENSKVKKGEIIGVIDCQECKAELENAKVNLNKIQNEINDSKNKINTIKNLALNEKNDINDAKLKLETANSDYTIYKNAYLDESVTKKDLDNAIKNLEIAQNEFEKAQNDLNKTKKELDLIIAKRTSQDNKLKQYISEITQAKLNLSYTTLISPINGNIKDLKIKIGDNVKKNENILKIIPINE